MSLAYYKQPLVVCLSGGKDSAVIQELALRADIPVEFLHNHTTADAPETVYFIRSEFKRLEELGKHFSEGARQELQMISNAVSEILDVTVDAFSRNDSHTARAVEPLEEVIDDMVLLLQDRHTQRLKKGECSVETGLVFMECLTYLERASDQCSSIAVKMLARDDDAILNNHHEYLRNVHAGQDSFFNEEMNRRRAQYIEPLKNIQL